MTKDDAARIFNVASNAKRREVDAAYSTLHHKYLTNAQNSTDPDERETAKNVLTLMQDAYPVLTGRQAPKRLKPTRARTNSSSSRIPTASLGGKPKRRRQSGAAEARSRTRACQSATNANRFRKTSTKGPWMNLENVVAFLISAGMFLIAISILAIAGGYAP